MPLCTFVFFIANQYYLPRLKANINRVECPARRSIISNDCNRAREKLFRQTEPNEIQDSCLESAVPLSLWNIVLVGCIRLFFHQLYSSSSRIRTNMVTSTCCCWSSSRAIFLQIRVYMQTFYGWAGAVVVAGSRSFLPHFELMVVLGCSPP